jgi:hypothetical protein
MDARCSCLFLITGVSGRQYRCWLTVNCEARCTDTVSHPPDLVTQSKVGRFPKGWQVAYMCSYVIFMQ